MKLEAPLDVQVELTNSCNHDCGYCYNPFGRDCVALSKEQLAHIIEQLSEQEVFSVVITGGEPLLEKETAFWALAMLKERGIEGYINTNLSVPLSLEEARKLKESKTVLFSFPSYNPDMFNQITRSESYDTVIANLRLLASKGVTLTANQVVTRENASEVYKTGKFLFDGFGIKRFCATPVSITKRGSSRWGLREEQYELVVRDLIKLDEEGDIIVDTLGCFPLCLFPQELRTHKIASHRCAAGRSTAAIGANGEVRRCILTSEGHGNVLEESFSTIWQRIPARQLCLPKRCKGCSLEETCLGICEVRADMNEGIDPVVRAPIENIPGFKRGEMNPGKVYMVKDLKFRKEKEEYLIVAESCIVLGNHALIDFLKKLRGLKFGLGEIRERMGERGVGLIRYLYERGLIEVYNERAGN